MIFCEGKTDIAYLQKALTLFGYEKEELDKQVKTRDHAQKVLDESNANIKALSGGIQFG